MSAPARHVLSTFHPELTELQAQVLDLPGSPLSTHKPGPFNRPALTISTRRSMA